MLRKFYATLFLSLIVNLSVSGQATVSPLLSTDVLDTTKTAIKTNSPNIDYAKRLKYVGIAGTLGMTLNYVPIILSVPFNLPFILLPIISVLNLASFVTKPLWTVSTRTSTTARTAKNTRAHQIKQRLYYLGVGASFVASAIALIPYFADVTIKTQDRKIAASPFIKLIWTHNFWISSIASAAFTGYLAIELAEKLKEKASETAPSQTLTAPMSKKH